MNEKTPVTTMEAVWYLYILHCGDDKLYTGIATDVEKRLEAHRCGKGAKYTRGRGPLELLYTEEQPNHGAALRREMRIKALTRREKLALCGLPSLPPEQGARKTGKET